MKIRVQNWWAFAIVLILFGYFVFSSNTIKVANSYNGGYDPYPAPRSNLQSLQNTAYPSPTDPVTNSLSSAYPPPLEPGKSKGVENSPSVEARKVIDYLKSVNKSNENDLLLLSDHTSRYPYLGRDFQVVTLVDNKADGKIIKYLVDKNTFEIIDDLNTLQSSEDRARQLKLGKFDEPLLSKLTELKEDEKLPVAIWIKSNELTSTIQEKAVTAILNKFPEAKKTIDKTKLMDVNDPNLSKAIYSEYVKTVREEIQVRVNPLKDMLKRRGFEVIAYDDVPSIFAVLPKKVIIELSKEETVTNIFLADGFKQSEMDSVIPTILVPDVWGRGITGSGVNIGILDIGNVDPNNSFLHLSPISRPGSLGIFDHATETASVAASFHNTYKGVAPNSTIISVGESGTESDEITALQWAFSNGVDVLNNSGGFQADTDMHWTDKVFDYWARTFNRMIVKSSGNTGNLITSPGKAWNIFTVGAFDDGNTAGWGDDQIWPSSAYINPTSLHNDREKPEVVAVGADVTVLSNNNAVSHDWGTSVAAPQVSGISALMIQRNTILRSWPESQKAILMASATHNIEGPSIITLGQGDLKDGAGAVNANLADKASQFRADSTNPCFSSCWWGLSINNSNFPVSSYLEEPIYIPEKSYVRIAISWWSNAESAGNNDVLDTDLDLRIRHTNGNWISSAVSISYDNNYEIVEFFAPAPGWYQIEVYKARANENSNNLGIGAVSIPLPKSLFLPAILKD